jgi:hypothetical protein
MGTQMQTVTTSDGTITTTIQAPGVQIKIVTVAGGMPVVTVAYIPPLVV